MRTEFIKGYIDELNFSNVDEKEMELLRKHGYTPDENGEVEVSFKFGDGIAFVPNGCGLVLRYPTLIEVSKSEEMQREIYLCTGIRNEINQKDIALRYGRLGEYKYVLDYDKWVEEDDNEYKDIASLDYRKNDKDYGRYAFDVFEDEYNAMSDKGLITAMENGVYYLSGFPTKEEIERMAAEYGILWTELLSDHIRDEKGVLQPVRERQKVFVVESCKFIDEQNYLDCFTEVYTDEEKAKLRVNELAKEYEHEGEIDTWGSLVGEYGYAFYYMDESKRKVKYAERELL